ncbi:MAG TPA: GGDEF domain-containing protein, partial [Bacteroidales bacterium]|nr:GGDEF domain-containing protein [Bacteroidales bacterium]
MKEYRVFEMLFDMIPFGIYVTNMKTYEIVYMNSIFREKFGEPKKRKCYELIFGGEEPCLFCKIDSLYDTIHNGESEAVISEQFNDKDDRYYRMEERAIYWPNGDIVKYTIAIDITEQKKTQNSLAEAHARLMLQSRELENKNAELLDMYQKTLDIAEKDHLTGLYNRRFFYEIGQSMLNMIARQKLEGYLVVIDIDHFKQINDTHGHIAGDKVLCSVAAIFQNSFRKSDLLGRIG